jgi:hypothetical protein
MDPFLHDEDVTTGFQQRTMLNISIFTQVQNISIFTCKFALVPVESNQVQYWGKKRKAQK